MSIEIEIENITRALGAAIHEECAKIEWPWQTSQEERLALRKEMSESEREHLVRLLRCHDDEVAGGRVFVNGVSNADPWEAYHLGLEAAISIIESGQYY